MQHLMPGVPVAAAIHELLSERLIWDRPVGNLSVYVLRTPENDPTFSDEGRARTLLAAMSERPHPMTTAAACRAAFGESARSDTALFVELERAAMVQPLPGNAFSVTPHGRAWASVNP